jgi:hypothetical protein
VSDIDHDNPKRTDQLGYWCDGKHLGSFVTHINGAFMRERKMNDKVNRERYIAARRDESERLLKWLEGP